MPAVILTVCAFGESSFNPNVQGPNREDSWGLTQIGKQAFQNCLSDAFIKSLGTDIKSPSANMCCYAKMLSQSSCSTWPDRLSDPNRQGSCNYKKDCLRNTNKTYLSWLTEKAQTLEIKNDFLQAIGLAEPVQTC